MRLVLLAAVAAVLLGACAPGAYVLEWDTPNERAPRERAVERVVEVERVIEVPVVVGRPRPKLPVITIPRQPVPLPPVEPPAPPAPPVEPPAPECSARPMPPKSPWIEKAKCDGSPAQLVSRP